MSEKVIFKRWPNGDVIALFPRIAATMNPYECEAYEHVGQHGAASADLARDLKPAKPVEYRSLATELRKIGYRLRVAQRFSQSDLQERRRQLQER